MTNNMTLLLRRFRNAGNSEEPHIDYGELMGLGPSGMVWTDLLALHCVVVLGEGNCGKSYEFNEQHRQRKYHNQYSFFIPLEKLHDHDFRDAMTIDEYLEFEKWKQTPTDEATFFLDAVDELKLRKGSLRNAINKIKIAINIEAHNARFFISCRPGDWVGTLNDGRTTSELDATTVKMLLPILHSPPEERGGKDLFLRTIFAVDDTPIDQNPEVTVVRMMPLTESEVARFAELRSPSYSERFIDYIRTHKLEYIYKWPGQVVEALEWMEAKGDDDGPKGVIELLEWSIQRRLTENSNKKRNELSNDELRSGAETLALALALTNKRVVTMGSTRIETALSILDILPSLSAKKHEDLLHKPLFTPSGMDEFQFYHRTTQEYLAAKRLLRLAESGMQIKELHDLLFGETKNIEVLIHSMESVTAWLAIFRTDVFDKVLKRKPQLLFQQTFPSLLSERQREQLVRAFITKYADSQQSRVFHPWIDLSRLVSPLLDGAIEDLWSSAYNGYASRELMLRLASITPMPQCAPLVYQAAMDNTIPNNHRVLGAQAVFRHGLKDYQVALSNSILSGTISDAVVMQLLPDLFPNPLSMNAFAELVFRLDESETEPYTLSSYASQAFKAKGVSLQEKIKFRTILMDKIWGERTDDATIHNPSSKSDRLSESLLNMCVLTVPDKGSTDVSLWARSMVIGYLYNHDLFAFNGTSITSSSGQRKILEERPYLCEAYLMAFGDIVDELHTSKDWWDRAYPAIAADMIQPVLNLKKDMQWLLDLLKPQQHEWHRANAFRILLKFLVPPVTIDLATTMQDLTEDIDAEKSKDLITQAMAWNPDLLKEYKHREQTANSKRQTQIESYISKWTNWHHVLMKDPTKYLNRPNGKRRLATLFYVTHEYHKQTFGRTDWSSWNAGFIEKAFSTTVLSALRIALAEFWRVTAPINRNLYIRNGPTQGAIVGYIAIMALYCEAERENWAKALTNDEAESAVGWIIGHIDVQEDLLQQIEAAHPQVVSSIVFGVLETELNAIEAMVNNVMIEDMLKPLLAIVRLLPSCSTSVNQRAASRIFEFFKASPERMSLQLENYTVKKMLKVVKKHGTEEQNQILIASVLKCFKSAVSQSIHMWLSVLSLFDFVQGCQQYLELTKNDAASGNFELTTKLLNYAVYSIDGEADPRWEVGATAHIQLIESMLERSFIDQIPLTDRSEFFRSIRETLLRAIKINKSSAALAVLVRLAEHPDLTKTRDVFKKSAEEIAEILVAPKSMGMRVFNRLLDKKTYQAHDTVSLFRLMENRLNDFEHDLFESQFSALATVKRITVETELRNFIGNQLNHMSRGDYTVTMESVVRGEKRNDIRIQPTTTPIYATIELKLDDTDRRWSGQKLLNALTEQLVGAYLQHNACRVGCLLICMREQRNWEHPVTGQSMDLMETVGWLQEAADDLVCKNPELKLWVKGIDLTKTCCKPQA